MRNVVELGGCPFVFSKSAPKTSHALGNANGHLGNEGDSGGAGSLCQVKFQPLFSWSDLEAEKMVAAIEKWKVGIPKMKAHRVALSTATIFFYEYVTFITRLSGKSYLSRGFWELPGKEQNSPGLCEKPTRGRRILSRWIFFPIRVLLLRVRTLKMKVTSNSWRKTSKKPRNLADVMVPTGAVSDR